MLHNEVSRSTVTTAPALEPLTLDEAKKHVEIANSDTSHDVYLGTLIQAAREQWENDTDTAVLTQTMRMQLSGFRTNSIQLLSRPVQSITSITYYDDGNDSQTLDADVYSLDALARCVRLNFDKVWPSTYTRWDAVTITYVAGYTARNLVPAIAKQAMLLLVGYYFDANRGDNDRPNDMRAYERLVMRYMRSSYP
jgi:uncharacterized phiE125 gp8 family phage protein